MSIRLYKQGVMQVPAGGGGGAWVPTDEASLETWIDASDTGTITDSGGAVSQIDDKSGNSVHFSQSAGSRQPIIGTRTINSLNVLDFDGSDDALAHENYAFPGGSSLQLAITAQADTAPSTIAHTLVRLGGSSRFDFWNGTTGEFRNHLRMSGSGNTSIGPHNPDVLGAPHIWVIVCNFSSGALEIWIDGLLNASNSGYGLAFDTGTFAFGADNATPDTNVLDCAVGELNLFSSVDSVIRQKTEGYLAHKWGLATNLPGGHPYKSSAP